MRIISLLFLLMIPALGMAKDVTVRSGEHTDFSRLTFEFSNILDWEMGRVKEGYEVRIVGVGSEIDLSEVYQRISHDRIKSLTVSADNSRITIELGCECYADAFEFRPGLLVVDVKDGLPPETSDFEAYYDTVEKAEIQQSSKVMAKQVLQIGPLTSEETPLAALPLRVSNESNTVNPFADQFGLTSEVEEHETAKEVVEMQSEMLQQISRAASQGLLDANIPHLEQAKPYEHATSEVSEQPSILPRAKAHINIHIENSIDREFSILNGQRVITDSGSKCLSDRLFNISEWGNEETMFSSISELRGLISSEFDVTNTKAVLDLAKAYIYAGFGAEALSILSQYNLDFEEKNALVIMAQIIDNETFDNQAMFSGQIGCDAASALWAALVIPSLSKQLSINRTAIIGAFSKLPVHLRRLIGPGLAEKFLKSGDLDTARALRNAIARSSGYAGSEFGLLNAKLDHVRGLTDSAEHVLEDIIFNDDSVAPRALIELLEVRLQDGRQIEPHLLATAESYIFEQQGSEIAADLKRLIALAYGKSGDFEKALHTLFELENYESLGAQEITETWETIVDNLIVKATEEEMLKFIYAVKEKMAYIKISQQMRRKLALRLLNDGWPVQAEMVLATPVSLIADDRVLLAMAKLQMGEAENVLKKLENVAGNKATKLRAQAYEISGRYLEAAQEYERVEDAENQIDAVWRAGDWAQLATIGSKTERLIANLMLSQNAFDDAQSETTSRIIAYDSTLIKTSESERKTIEQLLEDFQIIINEDP